MIKNSNVFRIALLIVLERSTSLSMQELSLKLANIPEDGRLQFCALANKYGYKCVKYEVVTEDGYILGLYNIPGNKCRPVYLQHGIVDSSDTFLLRTNTSLVAFLANRGFDVWLGNMRGNKYSRKHKTLNPERSEFWDFSFHEMAIYDLTAMIDFVLEKTKQKRLQAIAHSQGTTIFFALAATKPAYNEKIKVFICLSPIVHLRHAEPLLPLRLPIVGKTLIAAFSAIGPGELLGNSSQLTTFVKVLCSQPIISYKICIQDVAFYLFGRDEEQFEPDFLPMVMGHYPSGTSIKNGIHLLQLVTNKDFAQYDYGIWKNLMVYKSAEPPVYDLSKVSMNVVLTVGEADKVNNPKDIQLLRKQLPNVVGFHVIKRKEWNHSDFVWAKDMDVYIFPIVCKYLAKYCK